MRDLIARLKYAKSIAVTLGDRLLLGEAYDAIKKLEADYEFAVADKSALVVIYDQRCAEVDSLKAELAALREQKPVAHFIKSDQYQQVDEVHKNDDDVFPLYAAPGAQPTTVSTGEL